MEMTTAAIQTAMKLHGALDAQEGGAVSPDSLNINIIVHKPTEPKTIDVEVEDE